MAAQPLSPVAPEPKFSLGADYSLEGPPQAEPQDAISRELARIRSLGASPLAVEQAPIPEQNIPNYRSLARSIATGEPFRYSVQGETVTETEYGSLVSYAADKVPPEYLSGFLDMVREEAGAAQRNTQAGMMGRAGMRMGRAAQRVGRNILDPLASGRAPEWQAVYNQIDQAVNEVDPIQPPDAGLIEQGIGGAAENMPSIAATLATIPAGPLAVPLATGFWFTQITPERIRQFRAEGATEQDALAYGAASGLIESSVETLINLNPFGSAIGKGGKTFFETAKKWLAARGAALLKEAGEEGIQAGTEKTLGTLADSNPDNQLGPKLTTDDDEPNPVDAGPVARAMWQATIESLPTLVALQGAGSAVRFGSELPERIKRANFAATLRKRLQARQATQEAKAGESVAEGGEVAPAAAEGGTATEVSPQVARGMAAIQLDPAAAQRILDGMMSGEAISRSTVGPNLGRLDAAGRAELGKDVQAAANELQAVAQQTADRTRELLSAEAATETQASEQPAAQQAQPDIEAEPDWDLVGQDFVAPPAVEAAEGDVLEAGVQAAKAKPSFARIGPDALPGGKPQNAQARIAQAYKALNVGLTIRGRSMGNTLGYYRPGTGGVTIAKPGRFSTGAHELGHAMDHEFGLVRQWSGGQVSPYDGELMTLAQYGSSPPRLASPAQKYDYTRNEGVAEFIRAWLINPKAAIAAAPKFAAHFNAQVSQEAKSHLREFGDSIRQWSGLSAADKTGAQIRDITKEKTGLARTFEEAQEQTAIGPRWWVWLQDALRDQNYVITKIYELMLRVNGLDIEKVLPDSDIRILLQRMSGAHVIAERFHADGPTNFADDSETGNPGIPAMMRAISGSSDPYMTMRRAYAYMISQRVLDKANEIDDLAKHARDAYDYMTNQAFPPQIRRMARQVYLLVVKRLGLQPNITPDAIDAYVDAKKASGLTGAGTDLSRDDVVAKETVGEFATWGADEQARVKEFARLYRAYAGDLLRYYRDSGRMSQEEYDSIVDRNMYYIDMHRVAMRADSEFVLAARRLGNASSPINQFSGSAQEIDDPIMSLIAATHAIVGEAERSRTINAFVSPFLSAQRGMNDPRVNLAAWADIGAQSDVDKGLATPIYINGKMYPLIWKDVELQRAMKRLNKNPPMGLSMKILTLPARIMRAAITNSPKFMLNQIARDAQARVIQDDSGTGLLDGFRIMFDPKELAEQARMFERAGGGMFSLNSVGRDGFVRTTQAYMKEHLNDPNIRFTTWEKLSRMWGRARSNSEMVNRAAIFRKAYADARAEGLDEFNAGLRAMSKARDFQDFARGGWLIKDMDKVMLFLNPSIVAIETMLRKAKRDPAGMALRVGLFAVLAEVMILAFNEILGGSKYRQQEPSYVRDTMYKIYTRDLLGFDIVIPKPYQYAIPGAYLTRAYDAMVHGDMASLEGREVMATAMRAFVPVETIDLVGVTNPVLEMMLGRDTFRDRFIIPPHEWNVPVSEREGNKYSSLLARTVESAIGLDSRNVEFLMQSFGSGFGRIAITSSKFAEGKADMVDLVSATFGVIGKEPVRFARDVEWLYRYAARKSEGNAAYMRELRSRLDAFHNASGEDKKRLGRAAIDYATKMREKLDR